VHHGDLLSASDDQTTRVWDLRTNKGTILLRSSKREVTIARAATCAPIVITSQENTLNFFDLRKPSLVL
jgi:WD40 repeat protein